MIRVTTIANAQAAKNYFSSPDYYLEGQEEPALWHGKGAELLGLKGSVDYPDFEKLCDNINPQTNQQLTAKHIANRRVGYDWTYSVPKSVSLAYIAGDTRIADEFRAAVSDTMSEVEREMQTRVRKGGAFENRTTGNLIWTDFLHKTSRPIKGVPDPQLHVHAVVLNATYDHEEHQWKAGEFGALKANAPYFQAVFRARLANRLQALGYEITKTKDDFEITGISKETIKKFSRRTNLIEKIADKLQKNLEEINPNLKLSAEAKAKIGAGSREAKSDAFTWDQLKQVWTSQLKPEELEALKPGKPIKPELLNAASLDWSLRHLLERNSVVTERELVTTGLKHGLGNVTPEGIYTELGKRKDLIRRNIDGRQMVSTQGVLNEEKRIIAFAQKGRGRFRPLQPIAREGRVDRGPVSPDGPTQAWTDDAAIKSNIATLSPTQSSISESSRTVINDNQNAKKGSNDPDREYPLQNLSVTQQAAVRHAWSSRDRLILIRGAAGTGKTTMTKALLEGVNVPWVILAPSAEASRGVLRREGFTEAETLAKFLLDSETQEKARNGLIVLDEASLAGAHDMARLIESADKLNARVILLGDRRQHKSVARGDVLALLEDRASLPVAEVSEIRRQSGEYREAVKLASKGNVAQALKKLDALGWIKENHFPGVENMVADDYLAAIEEGKSVLVVSPTNAEKERVTDAIRNKLKQEGKLDGEEQRIETLQAENLSQAQAGDAETLRSLAGETTQFVRNNKIARAGQRVVITEENAAVLAKEFAEHAKRNPNENLFVVYKPQELSLAKGDLLRVTSGIKDTEGKRIDSGAMLTYLGMEKGKLSVETTSGTKRLLNTDVRHLQHGYAVTSFGGQGKTVDRVLIHAPTASFGAVDKSTGYVSISRGREKAIIYTDDKNYLMDAVERERPRLLASELVRRPTRGIRSRLKRHVAFLRDLGNEIGRRVHEIGRHRERELVHDRA